MHDSLYTICLTKENIMSSHQRTITIEDLYKLTPTSNPRISPDGKRVAFVVTSVDEHKQDYRSSIWIVPAAFPITRTKSLPWKKLPLVKSAGGPAEFVEKLKGARASSPLDRSMFSSERAGSLRSLKKKESIPNFSTNSASALQAVPPA